VAVTVKLLELANIPLEVEPLTGPVVALGMTRATSAPEDWVTGTAATPPMFTDCVVEKSVPVMVTNVPTGPEDGEKETGVLVDFEPPPQPLRTQIVKTKRHLTTQTAVDLISSKTPPIWMLTWTSDKPSNQCFMGSSSTTRARRFK
jgi:hypothetical protein